MNFEFSEEQKLFTDAVRRFALAHLQKIAEHVFDRRFDQPRHADAAE